MNKVRKLLLFGVLFCHFFRHTAFSAAVLYINFNFFVSFSVLFSQKIPLQSRHFTPMEANEHAKVAHTSRYLPMYVLGIDLWSMYEAKCLLPSSFFCNLWTRPEKPNLCKKRRNFIGFIFPSRILFYIYHNCLSSKLYNFVNI